MKMHSNTPKYIEYLADSAYVEWADAAVARDNRDVYSWAFVGNGIDGFKLVNKAAGGTKALVSTGKGNPAMGNYADGTSFKIAKSNIKDDKGYQYFCLQHPDTVVYLNAQSGKMAHWTAKDAGSTFMVEKRDLTGISELTSLIASAKVVKEDASKNIEKGIGTFTKEGVTALTEAIKNAEAAAAAKEGVFEADLALAAALKLPVVLPEAGKYYQIVSALQAFGDKSMAIYNNGVEPAWKELDKSVLSFYWTITPNADNTAYTFKNAADGRYLYGDTVVSESMTGAKLNWLAVGEFNIVYNDEKLHAQSHGDGKGTSGAIVHWDGGANSASSWKIMEADTDDLNALINGLNESKKTVLSSLATAEEADYYTYTDDVIASAKTTVQNVVVDSAFTSVIAGLTTIESVKKELAAAKKNGAPVAGDYIRLKNKAYGKYLQENDSTLVTSADLDFTTLWLVEAGSHKDTIKLKSVATNKYIGQIRNSESVRMVESDSVSFAWTNQKDVYAVFKDVTGGNYAYGHVHSTNKFVGWEPSADATQWLVSKVDIVGIREALQVTLDNTKKVSGDGIGLYAPVAALTNAQAAAQSLIAAESNDVAALASAAAALKQALAQTIEEGKINYPVAGKYYQIVSALQAFKEVKGIYANDSVPAWKTFNADDKSFYWTITPNADTTFTFQNLQDEHYLNGVTLVEKDTVKTKLQWLAPGEFNIVSNGKVLHANGHGNGAGVSGDIVGHSAGANSASSWTFVEVELPFFYDITYDYQYKGVTKATKTTSIKLGGAYPDFEYVAPWGIKIADSKPEGDVSESKTVVVNLVDDALPFKYVADYAAVEEWYYLKFHANDKNYLYYDATLDYLDATKTAIDRKAKEAYSWAFVGNPFDGFSVVNKKAGDKMVLSSAVEPQGNKEYPKMVTADTIKSGNKVWDLTKSSYGTDGFFMAYDGTTKRLNKQDGKVCYWIGAADAGSTFMVEVCSPAADLAALVAEAKKVNLENAGEIGCYTQAYADALTEAIEKAEAVTEATDADVLALETALNAVEYMFPEVGKFYRLKNAKSNNYMSGNKEDITLLANGAEAVSTIFYLGEGNTLLSYNAGRYLDCQAKNYSALGTAHEGEFNIAYGGMKAGVITYKNNSYWTFGNRAEGEGLDRGSAAPNQDGYNWVVEEVTWLPVAINTDYGYATLTSPVALSTYKYGSTTERRVNAYTGTLDGDVLKLNRIDNEDGIIPANTPVVIEYLADAENGYVFLQLIDFDKDVVESDLVGTIAAEAKGAKNAYTLQGNADKDGAVFKKYTGENLVGFKAYLDIETTAAAISIRKDDGTTGIEETKIQTIDAIYDLSGRRIEKMEKGIYIVNGRKVIVQ